MMKVAPRQTGSSLIEVLVAILLLSFGMLSLGGMLAFAVQMPKLSANRATATILAAQYIERIRANPGSSSGGYAGGDYVASGVGSYDGNSTIPALSDCTYATPCTETTLATMDKAFTNRELRKQLPAGGMVLTCNSTPCGTDYAELWIIWNEPDTFAALARGASNASDNCPSGITAAYTAPPFPRCLYVRFKVNTSP